LPNARNSRATAYHPAENEQAENANESIKGLLMGKVKSDLKTWGQHLGWASDHISTGYTPFTLMFGRDMSLPLDIMVGDPETTPDHYGDYVSQLKN